MKRLKADLLQFFHCKAYVCAMSLVALCCYGYTIAHPSIGMDDTAIGLYFQEGVAPFVGRWSFFVAENVFHMHIGDFAPWMTELLGVLILMFSITIWCVLWKRICEPRMVLPVWAYCFPACIFLSCPLISEVFVFYLHNGVCTAYGLTALSLLCLTESLSVNRSKRQRIADIVWASLLLTVALGFYESFSVVFVMGGVMAFFLLRRLYGRTGQAGDHQTVYRTKILLWMRNGFLVGASSLLLRMLILSVLNAVYNLNRLDIYNVRYRHLFGDNFLKEGELIMNLKRFWVMYYVNGIVYLPITVLVAAFAFIGIYSLYHGVRKRELILVLCSFSMVLLPILMSIVEGMPTRYRSGQYVPLVGAFAVLLLFIELFQRRRASSIYRILSAASFVFLAVLIYNQCADMNKWFYLDHMKYQNASEVMKQVAHDLEEEHDISKPIVFGGAYRVPYSISKDAYCSFSSLQYRWICYLTDPIDPYLKEKYYAPNGRGYVFTEMPVVSLLQWGVTAFDGTSEQLIQFMEMHGHSFRCVKDPAVLEETEQIRQNMPGYPENGYIRELEDYILVNLESL